VIEFQELIYPRINVHRSPAEYSIIGIDIWSI
jgi:hypothetical protein